MRRGTTDRPKERGTTLLVNGGGCLRGGYWEDRLLKKTTGRCNQLHKSQSGDNGGQKREGKVQ